VRDSSGAIPLAAGDTFPADAEGGGNTREKFRRFLRAGQLDAEEVELELSVSAEPLAQVFSTMGAEEMGAELEEAFARMMPRRTRRRRLTVAEARRVLLAEETEKLLDREKVTREAVERAENLGIIFIDELDKIVGGAREAWGPDVSREGVQRDLLPIVEGTTVVTRYGNVRTEHILFIAAGAFHAHKPSDLIPELQGRFPIRVELSALKEADLLRILKEPENSLLKQYQALLATEGVELAFEERAIRRMAEYAALANSRAEDIGARRLHTIVEKVLGELSFNAPDLKGREKKVRITEKYVAERLAGILADQDLAKYIL
jgi:ATP-dependent HslUV protease ATP-binding subunit HslU